MDLGALLASSPRELDLGGGQAGRSYRLAEDVIARHGAGASPAAILTLEGGHVSVEPALSAPKLPAEGVVGPVYRQVPGGGFVVPTGRALVRFAEGEAADEHRDALTGAGYELEEVIRYAPHAAWVRASSGEIADTLRNIPRLQRLANVANVEPQLLSDAARRG